MGEMEADASVVSQINNALIDLNAAVRHAMSRGLKVDFDVLSIEYVNGHSRPVVTAATWRKVIPLS